MASFFEYGDHLFIPFVNGRSVGDSQNRPRMYKTREAFDRQAYKAGPCELVEYAPVVHARWVPIKGSAYEFTCSNCKIYMADDNPNYCNECGAIMDLEEVECMQNGS